MTLFFDLVNTIHSSLHSFTGVQEQTTYLTAPITSASLTLAVNSTDQMNRGISEIDSELIYVDVADSNVLTIPPYGRGYRGSAAAAHAANAQITFDPVFPRVEIKRALAQAIQALHPTLYQIKHVDLTPTTLPIGYQLPADCQRVLDVKFQQPSDPYDYWMPLHNWAFDPTSPEVNGKAINLFDWVPAGSTVRVVYQGDFSSFANTSDGLHIGNPTTKLVTDSWVESEDISTLGLSETWIDLLQYAVCAQMVRFLDPSRLQIQAVENVSRSQFVANGDATKIASQLYAMYQQRLGEEHRKLLDLTPARFNFTR